MRAAWVIVRRELAASFRTPLAWTLIGLFSMLSGWIFFNILAGYADNIQSIPPEAAAQISFMEEVVIRLYANLHFLTLFFIPPITMRLLAEEKRHGTLDLLWAAPIRDTSIVLGKFLAAWMIVLALLAPTILYPLVLFWAGIPDHTLVGGCYLALVLTSGCYVAIGVLASSLTENPVVAALMAFVGILLSWLTGWAAQSTGNFFIAEVLHYLSVTGHFDTLVHGVLSSSDMIYFISFIGLALGGAVKSLASRNW